MTLARVLLTLSGFISLINGIIQLGPQASPAERATGVALVVVGLLTWALVWRLRRLDPAAIRLTAAVVVAIAAARVAQLAVVHAPTILLAVVVPLAALWRVARSESQPKPGKAVPITAAVLSAVAAAALAFALAPPDLPASASAPALKADQTSRTPGEPDPTGYLTATDGTKLAYFAHVPANPVTTLVFYHGSGANAGAGYLDFGTQLAERYHVARYLFDMRGHGRSGGRRGDAPTQDQMFADTQTAADFVKHTYPQVPEYIGGHSAGAGLVLNSQNRIDHEIAGYVYLAPDFGLHSGTEQQPDASNFATLSRRALIAYAVTNGLLDAHTYAVSFAYTQEEIDRTGMVSQYTTTMAAAQNVNPLGAWRQGYAAWSSIFESGTWLSSFS